MKNLLTRLGEQYVGVNICVDVTSNSELRRISVSAQYAGRGTVSARGLHSS